MMANKIINLFSKLENYIYILILVVLFVNLLKNVQQNSGASERVKDAREALGRIDSENEELKKSLQEVKTQQYIEEQARNKLGLSKDDEYVLVLPEPDLVKKLSFRRTQEQAEKQVEPNWKKWLDLVVQDDL